MREHARAKGSVFFPPLRHVSHSLSSSFLLLHSHTSCNPNTFIFYSIILFYFYSVFYSLESELVFLHPRFLRIQFHCFSFLYLLTHTFVYLLSFIHLSLSYSFFLFGATVSFVPAVPFMQILMATTESCEL